MALRISDRIREEGQKNMEMWFKRGQDLEFFSNPNKEWLSHSTGTYNGARKN